MSLAWATLVLLVLLIPGFLFFVGFYAPERMSREVAPTSPLGQLAGIVVVAFLIHALAYIFSGELCSAYPKLPCIDAQPLMQILRLENEPLTALKQDLPRASKVLDAYRVWILGYFVATGAMGFVCGLLAGNGVASQAPGLRTLARHAWMYRLISAKKSLATVEAFVMTNTTHNEYVLMYRGFLHDFYASADGSIKQLVLTHPKRYQMRLGHVAVHHFTDAIDLDDAAGLHGATRDDLLVISGQHLLNTYFRSPRPKAIYRKDEELLQNKIDQKRRQSLRSE